MFLYKSNSILFLPTPFRLSTSAMPQLLCEDNGQNTVVQFHLHCFKAWAVSFTVLCLCLLEEAVKAVGPFDLVSMPGEVKDPMQGKEQTSDGLTNSREGNS